MPVHPAQANHRVVLHPLQNIGKVEDSKINKPAAQTPVAIYLLSTSQTASCCSFIYSPTAVSIKIGSPLLNRQDGNIGREGFGLDEPSHRRATALGRHSLLVGQSHRLPLTGRTNTLKRPFAADQSARRAAAFSLPVSATCRSSRPFSNDSCSSVVMVQTSTISGFTRGATRPLHPAGRSHRRSCQSRHYGRCCRERRRHHLSCTHSSGHQLPPQPCGHRCCEHQSARLPGHGQTTHRRWHSRGRCWYDRREP